MATVDAFRDHLVGIKGPLTTPVGGGIRRKEEMTLGQKRLQLGNQGVDTIAGARRDRDVGVEVPG